MKGEFSVYWWDRDGGQYTEHRFIDGKTAVSSAKRLSEGPAAVAGMVSRVMITDGGDCCAFEWIKGKGIVHGGPP